MYGFGFGSHARRRLANSGGVVVPTPTATIAMPASVWAFGSSSMQGAHLAGASSGGTEDSLTNVVRAIEGLAAGSSSFTTISGSQVTRPIDYNLTGINAAHKVRNRGAGGATSGSGGTIASTVASGSGLAAANDLFVLHQGDNGLTVPGPSNVELLAGGYAAMRASAGVRPFIQIINTRGTSEGTTGPWAVLKAVSLRVQSDLNPGKVFSFHDTLIDRASPADANDLADLAVALPPRSYMMNDGSHQIAKGYSLQADAVLTPAIDAWAGGTPFPLKQIVEGVTPAVPAAGDVIGSIVAYGSGGSFALDASNTQTDYAISPSGQITRIGATPPARDVTWMAVKCSKAGRFDKVQPLIGVCERAAPGVSKLVEFDGASVVAMPDSKLLNSSKLTVLFRVQAVNQSTVHNVIGAASPVNQCLIRLLTNGSIDIVWRNAAGTIIFNKAAGGSLFSTTSPPRWVAICMDLSDPAAEVTKLITWVDPATASNNVTVDAALTADTTTAHLARLETELVIGAASLGGTTGHKFRLGDLTIWRDYIDFGVQARREEVSNADGSPKTAWVSGLGLSDGKTPNLRLAGNAADWRQGRITGSSVPATPGAAGQYIGFVAKERSASVPGYLSSV